MNCPKCFGEIKPNQRFCPTCGCEISTTEINEVKTMAADELEQPLQQPEAAQNQAAEQPADMQYQETQQPDGFQYQPTQQPDSFQYQPTQQPDGFQYQPTQQPDGFQYQPTEQPAMPQYQPTEQPAMPQYQPTEQPAMPQYQPTEQPLMPQYQTPVQPAPNSNDYSQQYSQYQQGSGLQGTRSGDGSLPPEKKKTTMIVLIAIIAALVIGGAVFAAIMIFGNKGDDNDNNSAPASSQTSVIESTSNTESTESSDIESSSSSTQPPTTTVESSTEATESTSSPVPLGDSNVVKNSNGIELARDAAIDTTDSDAESKIESFLKSQGVEDTTSSLSTMKFYAVGNVYVQEEQLLEKSTEPERATYKSIMESQLAGAETKLATMRTASGVSNMVYVYALLDSDNEIIYQKVIK